MVHDSVDLSTEDRHAAGPHLNVLRQRAEGAELGVASAVRRRAPVDLVVVHGTLQVGVQILELPERLVAEHTLERRAVPRRLRCPGLDNRGRRVLAAVLDEPLGVGDDALAVIRNDSAVDCLTRHARWTCTRFHVLHEVCGQREESKALLARTLDVLRQMCPQMMGKIVLAVEHALAYRAEAMVPFYAVLDQVVLA